MGRQERQLGFSDWQRSVVKKQTRRETFLSKRKRWCPGQCCTRAANSSEVVVAPELLHGEESVVYGDAGYQVLQKREEMEGKEEVECRIALRPGNRRRLPATAEGQLLQWVERAKAHIRAKVEHPFRVIKQPFGFCRTRLRGMAKNHCKVTVLATLAHLMLAKKRLLRLRAS